MVAIAEQINNIKLVSQQLYEKDSVVEREHRRLKAFNTIIVKANESTNQKELVQAILEAAIDFAHFDIGGIYFIKEHHAQIVATKFIPDNAIDTLNKVCIERPELRELFQFGKPIYIRDYHVKYSKNSALLGGIKTLISVPILYDNKVKGCINIGAFNDVEISVEDCDILRTLGKHLGHVLHRFEVERELELKNFDLEVHIEELRATAETLNDHLKKLESSQQQLDIERQNFRTLFNKMTDMIFVVSLEGNIVSINDAVRTRLGYPNGNLIGKPITIVHDPNQCTSVMEIINEMISDERNHCSMELYTKSGEVVKVDSRVVKGLWNGQEVLFGVSREVT